MRYTILQYIYDIQIKDLKIYDIWINDWKNILYRNNWYKNKWHKNISYNIFASIIHFLTDEQSNDNNKQIVYP